MWLKKCLTSLLKELGVYKVYRKDIDGNWEIVKECVNEATIWLTLSKLYYLGYRTYLEYERIRV